MVTVDCAAETELGVMVNAGDVAPVSPPLDAASVYPAPARSANVATPLAAVTVPPPVSVPPPALVWIVRATPFVAPVTRLLNWSRISTWTAGVIVAPAAASLGCTR